MLSDPKLKGHTVFVIWSIKTQLKVLLKKLLRYVNVTNSLLDSCGTSWKYNKYKGWLLLTYLPMG